MIDAAPARNRTALYGLVLAGGRGVRLGRDKGTLDYHGMPQARWAFDLLTPFCARRFVSIRAEQAEDPAYRGLPLLADRGASEGPASGLAAALDEHAGAAWLVIAADMPLLDRALIEDLVAARDDRALATAFRHADGTPEPLCAIWEPAVRPVLEAERRDRGTVSLRRVLSAGPAKLLDLADDSRLVSANTPADDVFVRSRLRSLATP